MKRNKQHPALSRVRSFFSSLMLATVLALSLGSCADKSADEEVKPTAKAASTKADIVLASHYIQLWIPYFAGVTGYSIISRTYGQVYCADVKGFGWLDTGHPIVQGEKITIILYGGNNPCFGDARIYKISTLVGPGRDGYKYLWVTLK